MSSPTPTDNNENNDGNNAKLPLATNMIVSENESTHDNLAPLVLPDRSLFDDDDGSLDEEDDESPGGIPKDSIHDVDNMNASTGKGMTEQELTTQGDFSFVADTSPLLESFVQQANRVHALVSKAWQAPQCLKRAREVAIEEEREEPLQQRRRLPTDTIVEKIAQEKTEEVVALQRVSICRQKYLRSSYITSYQDSH